MRVSLLAFCLFFVYSVSCFAIEKDYNLEFLQNNNLLPDLIPTMTQSEYKPKPNKNSKIQMSEWMIFDSLANALSYHGTSNYPIYMDPVSHTLVTVMRGSHEVNEPGFNANTSKNNLFIRYSTDMGITWSSKQKVYDVAESGIGEGRYPSIVAVSSPQDENTIVAYFTGPLVNELSGTWFGYVTGVGILGVSYAGSTGEFNLDGKTYAYGRRTYNANEGTFSTFTPGVPISGTWDGDAYFRAFSAAPAYVAPGGDIEDNNTIVFWRTTEDFTSNIPYIPENMKSSNFAPVDSVQFRTNSLQNMRSDHNGKYYLHMNGNFMVDGEPLGRFSPAIYVSEDDGETWAGPQIFPRDYIEDFIVNFDSSIDPDSVVFASGFSNDFVVQDNGDHSFIGVLVEADGSKGLSQRRYMLTELYYESGEYGVRFIADIPQVAHAVQPSPTEGGAVSPMSYEIQVARTVDGSQYFVKWVEIEDYSIDDMAGTYTYNNTNIYCAYRKTNENTWSGKINLTNDDLSYRTTWIPSIVKNDFEEIPILRVRTKGEEDFINQRLYLASQYVMTAIITADDLNSVETANSNIELKLFPNPASNNTNLTVFSKNPEHLKIELFDLLGNKISTIFNDYNHNNRMDLEINTTDLRAGTYIINVTNSAFNLSKQLNVVK